MQHIGSDRISWKQALKRERPLLLPVAHDALSSRIIEQAGFAALQVGGFAVEGSRHGVPDGDLTHFAERFAAVKDIAAATKLPIMVDGDDGYGDAKNVSYTVRSYEALGTQAIFLEDQLAPKKCGHMEGKKVVPVEAMVN
jgi:2-methylisocitrate lyase-like PEP mutase family enzyme